MNNLYLCGYRCTGKTTVGRMLAEKLFRRWVDSDEMIQISCGCTIAEMFSERGEEAFRDVETNVVERISKRKRNIVSLGGGAVLREENREFIKSSGKVIWLKALPETIIDRLGKDLASKTQRPSLTEQPLEEEVRSTLEKRIPIYEGLSDLAVETDDKSIVDLVADLAQWCRAND